MADLLKAKASGDKAQIIEAITEMLRPEAREAVEACKKNVTTKDGYGSALAILSTMGQYKKVFVEAMVREGYPADTAKTLLEIA